jgi:hypothetical protein
MYIQRGLFAGLLVGLTLLGSVAQGQVAYLADETKLTIAITPTAGAAGATGINGATLDMAGWDGVLVVVPFGAIVTGAVTSIKAQQGAASDCSDCADLAGTGQTVADDSDDKSFYLDLRRPAERYVRVVVSRATQNATVGGATYIQYRGRAKPTAAHGTNVAGERHLSPAEGSP